MKRVLVDWGITIESLNPLVYITFGAARYCGKEIELNLPITPRQARMLINAIVSRCKKNQEKISPFMNMKIYSMPVIFKASISVKAGNGYIWRMILPDDKGKYPHENGCNQLFKQQYIAPQFLN